MIWLNLIDILISILGGYMFYGIDVYGNIYLYIDSIIPLKQKHYQTEITGIGSSLEDAAFSYIILLLYTDCNLRSKYNTGYHTKEIKSIIQDYIQKNIERRLLCEHNKICDR